MSWDPANPRRVWVEVISEGKDLEMPRMLLEAYAAEHDLIVADASSERQSLLAADKAQLSPEFQTRLEDDVTVHLVIVDRDLSGASSDERHAYVQRLTGEVVGARLSDGSAALVVKHGEPSVSGVEEGNLPKSNAALAKALSLFSSGKAEWQACLFTLDAKHTTTSGAQRLDVTGRPRFLVFGPYFTLTPGRWRASFTLSFDAYAAQMKYWIDWGGVDDYTRTEVRPGRAGLYNISLDYLVSKPEPMELRIILTEGAFDGVLEFSGALIERVLP